MGNVKRASAAVVTALAMGMAAGCGLAPAPEHYQSGAMGANARIGQVRLLSVHVEGPADYAYEAGDHARLWLTLLNDGQEPDALLAVRTPAASRAEIRWDADCDGQPQSVPRLPLLPAGVAPVETPTGAAPFDAYHVRLVDLARQVLAGTTIPVTFTFEHAGQITVETYVQPSVPRAEPSLRCHQPSAGASGQGR